MTEINRSHLKVYLNSYFMLKMIISCFNGCSYQFFLFQVAFIITASCHGQKER